MRETLTYGGKILARETSHQIAGVMISLFSKAEGFVSVEIFAGDELDDSFLFEVLDGAGGVGWLSSKAIQGDIERAGIEEFNIFAVFEKAPEEDALWAIKIETRIIKEAPNFTNFVRSSLVLVNADLFAPAFNGFHGFNNFLNNIYGQTSTRELW